MSLDSVWVGPEDYKFKNEQSLGVWIKKGELSRPLEPAPHICLKLVGYKATYADTTTTHPNL